jgi:NTP pyrophosphatase (non-canonical NTP hydrolase)
MDMNELVSNFRGWGLSRKIIQNSSALMQFEKTKEEVQELEDGLLSGNHDEIADAIGDIVVTLVMVASCAGLDFTRCCAGAWEEIKDRKGHLNEQGIFVKES